MQGLFLNQNLSAFFEITYITILCATPI